MAGTRGRYWLVKTEPDTFSFSDLEKNPDSGWDGVRNYQARNNLRAMRLGDRVLVYHSNTTTPGVVGVAEVTEEHLPDPTQFDDSSPYHDPASTPENPRWSWVRLRALHALKLVSLEQLKAMSELDGSQLTAKGNRLSVLELTRAQYQAIVKRGKNT